MKRSINYKGRPLPGTSIVERIREYLRAILTVAFGLFIKLPNVIVIWDERRHSFRVPIVEHRLAYWVAMVVVAEGLLSLKGWMRLFDSLKSCRQAIVPSYDRCH